MKNPFFRPTPADPLADYKYADAYRAAEQYLKSSAPYEEIEDRKLRTVHPDLAEDEVWADVREKLEAGAGSTEDEPAAARERSRGATKRTR